MANEIGHTLSARITLNDDDGKVVRGNATSHESPDDDDEEPQASVKGVSVFRHFLAWF